MGNVNMEAEQVHYRNNSLKTLKTVKAAIDNLFSRESQMAGDITDLHAYMLEKAAMVDIAPEFSAEQPYFMDDIVYNNRKLYRFTADHDAGEWDLSEVELAEIGDIITSILKRPAPVSTFVYTETHTAQSSANFSHTFERQPKVILAMIQPYTALSGHPYFTVNNITFDDDGNLLMPAIAVANSSGQIGYMTLTWDKTTLTLTYTAGSVDSAFNRTDSKITYLA